MDTVILDSIFSMKLIVALALGTLATVAWCYFAWCELASRPWQILLITLRALAVAVVILILLSPSTVSTEKIVEKAPVALLLDRSRSMDIRDLPDKTGRSAALDQILAENRKTLETLADRYHFVALDFGNTAAAVKPEGLWPAPKRGAPFRSGTHLGEARRGVRPWLRRSGDDGGDGVRALFDDLDAVVAVDDLSEVGGQTGLRIGQQLRAHLRIGAEQAVVLAEPIAAHPPSPAVSAWARYCSRICSSATFASWGISQTN